MCVYDFPALWVRGGGYVPKLLPRKFMNPQFLSLFLSCDYLSYEGLSLECSELLCFLSIV